MRYGNQLQFEYFCVLLCAAWRFCHTMNFFRWHEAGLNILLESLQQRVSRSRNTYVCTMKRFCYTVSAVYINRGRFFLWVEPLFLWVINIWQIFCCGMNLFSSSFSSLKHLKRTMSSTAVSNDFAIFIKLMATCLWFFLFIKKKALVLGIHKSPENASAGEKIKLSTFSSKLNEQSKGELLSSIKTWVFKKVPIYVKV